MLGIWIDIRSYCIDLVCFLLIFSVLGIRIKPRALYELEILLCHRVSPNSFSPTLLTSSIYPDFLFLCGNLDNFLRHIWTLLLFSGEFDGCLVTEFCSHYESRPIFRLLLSISSSPLRHKWPTSCPPEKKKSPRSGHRIQLVPELAQDQATKSYQYQTIQKSSTPKEILYKPASCLVLCNFSAKHSPMSFPLNLLCEHCFTVWLCVFAWLPAARIHFPSKL